MRRKITRWTLMIVLSSMLAACATTGGYYSSRVDDIYYRPSKTERASTVESKYIANNPEISQLKSQTQAAIQESANRISSYNQNETASDYNAEHGVLSTTYEDSYERRLRGYDNPYYGAETKIRILSSRDWMLVSSYDPDFYNVIVMGDEIWVEPKYVSSMFLPVRTTINLNFGWRWGSSYSNWGWDPWDWPRYSPWRGYSSWGWNWGWGAYNPWYWNSWGHPFYGYGSSWYGHYPYSYGHGYGHNNHWGLGVPSASGASYYGPRGSATAGTISSASTRYDNNTRHVAGTRRPISAESSSRRSTRNIELVEGGRRPINTGTTAVSDNSSTRRRGTNSEITDRRTSSTSGDRRGTSSTTTYQTGRIPANNTGVSSTNRRGTSSTTTYQTGRIPANNTGVSSSDRRGTSSGTTRYTRPTTTNDGYNNSGVSTSTGTRRDSRTVNNSYRQDTRNQVGTPSSSSRSVGTSSSSRRGSTTTPSYNNSSSSSRRGSSSYNSSGSSSSTSRSSYSSSSSSSSSRPSSSYNSSSSSSNRSSSSSSSSGSSSSTRRR